MVDCDVVDAVHCLEDEVRRVGSRDCVSGKYTKGRDLDERPAARWKTWGGGGKGVPCFSRLERAGAIPG